MKEYDLSGKIINELVKGKGYIKKYNNIPDLLSYECEYRNGEKNGKGKEYNYKGQIKFDGEYLNGKRWNGNSKIYYNTGEINIEYEYIKEGKYGI